MANLKEIESEIKIYKKKYQDKKDSLIRAKARKEQCEATIEALKGQLEELGVKDVDNPEKELLELEQKIEESLKKIGDIIDSLDA